MSNFAGFKYGIRHALLSLSYGSLKRKEKVCLFRRRTDAFNSPSWGLGIGGNGKRPFGCCRAKIYANVFRAEPSRCQRAGARTHTQRTHMPTNTQQSYPACRRSVLHKHTMKSPTLAAHLHDIIAEVLETRRLTSGGTLALFA